jgi:hypothetical protein
LSEDESIEGVLVRAGSVVVSGPDDPFVVFQTPFSGESGVCASPDEQQIFFTEEPLA